MQYLANVFLFIQGLACFAGIIYWNKYKGKSIWIFLPFLIYSFLNELLVIFMIKNFPEIGHWIFYNIYAVVSFIVYLYWFNRILKLGDWIWVISVVFLGGLIYDIIFLNVFNQLAQTALFVQAVLLVLLSLIYFIRLLKSDEVIHFQKIPEFWIIFGLLVFHTAFIPLSLISETSYYIRSAYIVAINILNYILYSCYITAFYVSSR